MPAKDGYSKLQLWVWPTAFTALNIVSMKSATIVNGSIPLVDNEPESCSITFLSFIWLQVTCLCCAKQIKEFCTVRKYSIDVDLIPLTDVFLLRSTRCYEGHYFVIRTVSLSVLTPRVLRAECRYIVNASSIYVLHCRNLQCKPMFS